MVMNFARASQRKSKDPFEADDGNKELLRATCLQKKRKEAKAIIEDAKSL